MRQKSGDGAVKEWLRAKIKAKKAKKKKKLGKYILWSEQEIDYTTGISAKQHFS